MENVKYISLKKALKRKEGTSIFYVLPAVAEPSREENKLEKKRLGFKKPLSYTFGVFIEDEFYLVNKGLRALGNTLFFRAGMRLSITYDFDTEEFKPIEFMSLKAPKQWDFLGEVNGARLHKGQNILITAPPESGKSYLTKKILNVLKTNNKGVSIYRLLFGERKDDDLGPGTIDCDSSAPLEYQVFALYKYLTLALKEAYGGKDVIIAIDSLSRMMIDLSGEYSHTHMTSGGISGSVNKMVNDLFRMSGWAGESGSLTFIGTSLWSKSSNTWKNTYLSLAAVATAEFHPDVRSGKQDSSRKETTVKPDNKINIFGLMELHF
jgi:hypothetical protein